MEEVPALVITPVVKIIVVPIRVIVRDIMVVDVLLGFGIHSLVIVDVLRGNNQADYTFLRMDSLRIH